MARRPEDFNLPLSAVKKILQDAMPDGVHVTDGAKLALSKAASIFILYLTTAANGFSQDCNRRRVLGKDVLEALEDLDLEFLVPPLQRALAEHHKSLLNKKQSKAAEVIEEEVKILEPAENIEEEIVILSDSEVAVPSSSDNSNVEEISDDDDET